MKDGLLSRSEHELVEAAIRLADAFMDDDAGDGEMNAAIDALCKAATTARPAPAGATEADYAEASRILGRNALVETDAPEVVAAARAVCDAYTGVIRSAPAGSEESEVR